MTTCLHDPNTAQRQCACDPACVCRIGGNCPAMSGDVVPPSVYSVGIDTQQHHDYPDTSLKPVMINIDDLLDDPVYGTLSWPQDREALAPHIGEPLVAALNDADSTPIEAFSVGCSQPVMLTIDHPIDRQIVDSLTRKCDVYETIQLPPNSLQPAVEVPPPSNAFIWASLPPEDVTRSGVPSPKDRATRCTSNECQIRGVCTRVPEACISAFMLAGTHEDLLPEKPIEVVPPERLRAELAVWQDEWPGVTELEDRSFAALHRSEPTATDRAAIEAGLCPGCHAATPQRDCNVCSLDLQTP